MTSLHHRLALIILACASYASSQVTSPVRIDDSNIYSASNRTGIQYSRRFTPYDWNSVTTGDPTQRYQNTYTQTQTWRSQLWASFSGSSIAYYADKPPGSGALVLSIDGQPNINVTWTNPGTTVQYQQLLWSSGALNSGDHALVIGNIDQNNGFIGLDYLAVTPWSGTDITPQRLGPGASSLPAEAVVVDSEDTKVLYSGSSWEKYVTGADGQSQLMYFNGTEQCTKTPGSVATFQFNGTALWCFADNFSASSNIKLSIDGGADQIINAATDVDNWSTQWMFCNVTGLSAQPHTVTLTHAGASSDYACIDFLMYLPSSASPVTPTVTPTATSTTSPTSVPAAASSSKSVPVGAIAGGVAGGVVFIALLVALAYILRQKRQSRRPVNDTNHESYTGAAAYQTKQIDPAYMPNNLGPASTFGQRPHSPYSNLGGGASVAPTAWTGTTYAGHPEL